MPPSQQTKVISPSSEHGQQTGSTNLGTLDTIDEQDSQLQTPVMNVNYENVTATYYSSTNEVEVHIPFVQNQIDCSGQQSNENNTVMAD